MEPRSPRGRVIANALRRDDLWRHGEKKLGRSLEFLRTTSESHEGLSLHGVQGVHGLPLIETLLQRARELRYHDPKAVRWLSYNAVTIAENLRPEEYEAPAILDTQAWTWAELANAYRLNGELTEAEAAFERARALVRRGSGDVRCLAHVADLEGSLRNTQGRHAEANSLFDRVHRLYLSIGDQHLAGKALIALGNADHDEGGSPEAVWHVRKGLVLMDPDRDPKLALAGTQILIWTLASSGQAREAGELILKSGLRQRLRNDSLGLLRLRWVEGMVLKEIGKTSAAERALLSVRGDFMDLGKRLDAALIGSHLMTLWLQQGRSLKVKQTAREVYSTLRDFGVHSEKVRRAKLYM